MDAGASYRVRISIDGLDDDHQSVEAARDDLIADLREQRLGRVEIVNRKDETGKPTKGWLQDLILTAPADAAALARIIHLWLKRDRSRSIELTSTTDATGKKTVRISGKNISAETMEAALKNLEKHDEDQGKKPGKGSSKKS